MSAYCTPGSAPYSASNLDTYKLINNNPVAYQATTAALVNTLNQAVKDYIVKKHNCLRTLVIPTAMNMLEMVWNDEVALGAQQHADNCVFAHNANSNRSTSRKHQYLLCLYFIESVWFYRFLNLKLVSEWDSCGQNLFMVGRVYQHYIVFMT